MREIGEQELLFALEVFGIKLRHAIKRAFEGLWSADDAGANCLAHGRRQIVEVVDNFPEECRYVLEMLSRQ